MQRVPDMTEKTEKHPARECSRRDFFKYAGAAALLLTGCRDSKKADFPPVSPGANSVPAGQSPSRRVVAVHDPLVSTWDGVQSWYGSDSFVNQQRVDAMVKEALLSLTGETSEAAAWRQINPRYLQGNKISVKINENNSGNGGNVIDPLPQLLTALAGSLKAGGVDEADIWFLDPSRTIDDRIARPVKAAYPGVVFFGSQATAYSSACTYSSSDPGLIVIHGDRSIAPSRLPDQLGESTSLIHMPIMKAHGYAGVTLTYKNLFGLFESSTIPKFHNSFFTTINNPLVEIYSNKHVGGKTVLIIGDGVYGNWESNYTAPTPWNKAFGSDLWPKRIFASQDPVAMDCVLYDFLNWQRQDLTLQQETYLVLAANASQGRRDHWNNPTDRHYSRFDFLQLTLPAS